MKLYARTAKYDVPAVRTDRGVSGISRCQADEFGIARSAHRGHAGRQKQDGHETEYWEEPLVILRDHVQHSVVAALRTSVRQCSGARIGHRRKSTSDCRSMRWLQSGLSPATARESETDYRVGARNEPGFRRRKVLCHQFPLARRVDVCGATESARCTVNNDPKQTHVRCPRRRGNPSYVSSRRRVAEPAWSNIFASCSLCFWVGRLRATRCWYVHSSVSACHVASTLL